MASFSAGWATPDLKHICLTYLKEATKKHFLRTTFGHICKTDKLVSINSLLTDLHPFPSFSILLFESQTLLQPFLSTSSLTWLRTQKLSSPFLAEQIRRRRHLFALLSQQRLLCWPQNPGSAQEPTKFALPAIPKSAPPCCLQLSSSYSSPLHWDWFASLPYRLSSSKMDVAFKSSQAFCVTLEICMRNTLF